VHGHKVGQQHGVHGASVQQRLDRSLLAFEKGGVLRSVPENGEVEVFRGGLDVQPAALKRVGDAPGQAVGPEVALVERVHHQHTGKLHGAGRVGSLSRLGL